MIKKSLSYDVVLKTSKFLFRILLDLRNGIGIITFWLVHDERNRCYNGKLSFIKGQYALQGK